MAARVRHTLRPPWGGAGGVRLGTADTAQRARHRADALRATGGAGDGRLERADVALRVRLRAAARGADGTGDCQL